MKLPGHHLQQKIRSRRDRDANRIIRILSLLEDSLLVLILSAMIMLAVSQIFLRNLWDSGFTWGDPMLRVMVLWVTMLGALVATWEGNHISIDVISRYLPATLQLNLNRFTDLFAALVCGLLSWHSGRFVYLEWQDGVMLLPSVPAWLCELIMPLGFGLMSLRFLLCAISGRPPEGQQ